MMGTAPATHSSTWDPAKWPWAKLSDHRSFRKPFLSDALQCDQWPTCCRLFIVSADGVCHIIWHKTHVCLESNEAQTSQDPQQSLLCGRAFNLFPKLSECLWNVSLWRTEAYYPKHNTTSDDTEEWKLSTASARKWPEWYMAVLCLLCQNSRASPRLLCAMISTSQSSKGGAADVWNDGERSPPVKCSGLCWQQVLSKCSAVPLRTSAQRDSAALGACVTAPRKSLFSSCKFSLDVQGLRLNMIK